MSYQKELLDSGYIIVLPLIFVASILFFLAVLDLIFPARSALEKQLKIYDRRGVSSSQERTSSNPWFLPNFVAQAAVVLAKKGGFGEEIRSRLEQADIPLKLSEFVFLHLLGVITVGGLSYFWAKSWTFMVLSVIIGAILPLKMLDYLKKRRIKKFHLQLPETLSLIAGALKAGYSFLQALDMAVEETKPPISSEFAKVLTEARLGLSLQEALDNLAKRIRSTDLNWTIMAVKIQKEVGGNLAEVLEILADTLRERGRITRQIKTLTAEGRLSAIILFLLPFVIGFLIYLLNPDYLRTLTDTSTGKIMVAFALGMMLIGGFWLKKVTTIEV